MNVQWAMSMCARQYEYYDSEYGLVTGDWPVPGRILLLLSVLELGAQAITAHQQRAADAPDKKSYDGGMDGP